MMKSVKNRVATSKLHFHLFRETRNHFYFEINLKIQRSLHKSLNKIMPFHGMIIYIDWKSIELHKKRNS